MPVELTTFQPASAGELASALEAELGSLSSQWWTENQRLVRGYLNALAEASLHTTTALAEGLITPEDADRAFQMQKVALNQTLHFTRFMTLALAQQALDTAFRLVGWAVFNRTGVNLFPQLVKPA